MALKIGDRVRENTSSTGVGGLSLTGAPAGFQTFSSVLASGDTTYYSLEENDKFEVGIGTYGSNNLERTTVLSSSNSGNKISLGGSGVVFITYPAAKAIFNSETDQLVLPVSGLLFNNGTAIKDAKLVELSDVSLSGTPVQNSVFDLNITNKSLSIGDLTGPTNSNNILIGYGAGSGITTGSDSVIIGAESSTINKTGQHNVHIGTKAGPVTSDSASSVYNSVAVGYSAGNKMRHESIAIGYQSAENAYEIGFIGIGYQVGNGLGSYSTAIGYQAANSLGEDYAISLGYQAGYNGAGESVIWIGQGAGHSSTGSTKSIGIGKNAGKSSSGTECIYIGEGAGTSNSANNLVFVGNAIPSSNGTLIKGDMDSKRIAVGVADVTLDDTFFVGINSANDEGVVVKGAVSQVSNLTSWKNNSDAVLASVSKDGVVSAHEIVATGNGIQIANLVPASTTNRLYNNSGELYFNGSAVGGGDVTTDQLNYVSGIAVYGSGQTIENEANITALLSASGTATSLIASSGIATYASGQAVSNQSSIVTNASNISTNTARVSYASGQAISNQSNITALLSASGTATSLISSSGIATYASGQAIANEGGIVAVSGIAVYASGHVHDDLYISGVASYASGQAISNQSEIIAVSGWSDSTFLKIDDDTYVSGIAAYGSGQAISNQSNITTNASNISTNTGNISSNTAKVNYASGQAIENESDIAALLSASGTATSLVASSGIANYASGQAVSNQASISTNASNITYVSGVATNKFVVTAADSSNYTIDGMGLNSATDPVIYLHKGHTYYFDKQTASHPFRVSTSNGGAAYQDADGNNIEISGQGTLKFEVPQNAPDKLYYYCTSHAAMNGVIYTTNNVDEIIHVSGIAAYASGQAITNQSNITALNTASGIATSLLAVSGTATSLVSTSGIASYASGQAVSNQSSITSLLTASGTATSLIASSGIASYASGQAIANESDIVAVSGIAAYASGTSGAGGSITVKEADGSPNVSNVTTIVVSNGTLTDNGGGQVTVTTGGGGGGGDVTTGQLNYVSGIAVYGSGQAILNQSNITALNTASGIATSLLAVSGTATSLVATSGIATYASGNTANISFGSNAEGDLLYHNGTSFIRLPKGANDYILKMDGNVPNWEADTGGSSLSAGSGILVDGASKINVYGGSGNFQELQVTSDNVFVPKIIFTGSGAVDTPITLETRSSYESVSGSGSALLFQGTQGQLFSITDNLSSGVIFSVADIAGLPLIEADASGDVKLGEFGRYVGVGSGVPQYGLDISASGRIQKGVVLSSYVPAVTTNTLYNEGGTLKFNGSSIGGGGVDTYTSGVATYASGQAISNQSSITALNTASGIATSLLSVSGTATSLIASSGIATYASGQAIANESDILATSGIAAYASGLNNYLLNPSGVGGISITSDVDFVIFSGDATLARSSELNYVSGVATYASGNTIATQAIANYASGQAIENEGLVTYASGNTANISFGSNAEGDLLYHNGTSFIRLPKGTDDYILKMNGNVPNWEADTGGSSLSAGSGVFVDGASKINIHSGTGNFQEVQLTSTNTFTPKMIFTGSGIQDTPVTLKVLSSHASVNTSGTALSFEGTQGQLFGITDNLSSGNIFTVNDITGLPLISADASGDVKIGQFGRYVGIGTGVPLYGFDVSSSGQLQKGVILSDYVPATTTNALYNDGGTLKFNGSAVGGGSASAEAQYASGQAISNQSNITALLTASGTATSLIASSGIASYASGQAVSNQSNITALNTASGIATSLVASSGIATYSSGVLTGGIANFNKVGINTGSPAFGLDVTGAGASGIIQATGLIVGVSGIACNGHFSATTKSFLIDHPTKDGMKLQYASLEGPENGVYIRGTSGSNIITLPEYWSTLVDQSTVTVSLTAIGYYQALYIEEKGKNYIKVGGSKGSYDYVVYGERKDVEKLKVEW